MKSWNAQVIGERVRGVAMYEAGDEIIYMRMKPGGGVEELAGRYVHPHGARTPYGWKRHLIFVGDKRLYVNITSIRRANYIHRRAYVIDLKQAFEAADKEFLKFELIEHPLHRRPDICAFIRLDQLVPGKARDMVCAAEHDEIYLDVEPDELAKVATQDDIVYLHRCGVRFDSSTDSLAMFV